MRHIHLADGLRLRFPARQAEFNEGVEVGMLAALMSLGQAEITRRISPETLEQMACLAGRLGYHLAEQSREADWVDVTFRSGRVRPKLRLVHARSERISAAVG